jgi:hypothetical protein
MQVRKGQENPAQPKDKAADAPQPGNQVQPATSLTDALHLTDERNTLESRLSPEQKRTLQEYRFALSCTNNPSERAKLKKQINDYTESLNPEFSKLREKIDQAVLESQRTLRTMAQNLAADNLLPRIDVIEKGQEKIEKSPAERLVAAQDDWYSPYQEAYAFAQSRGIHIELPKAGEQTAPKFYLDINGRREYLQPIDTSKDLETQFNQIIDNKLTELEKKYPGITFIRVGQKIPQPLLLEPDGKFIPGNIINAARPSIITVHGIEQSLESCAPILDGAKLNICFLTEPVDPSGSRIDFAGHYWQDINKQPTVAIFFESNEDSSALTPKQWADRLAQRKETATHESEHYIQDISGFDTDNDRLKDLGWLNIDGKEKCLMRTKDGKYLSFQVSKGWLLCNEKEEAINRDGKVIKDGFIYLTTEEARNEAAVRPLTDYCHHPREVDATAAAAFKSSIEDRTRLAMNDKILYTVAKDKDQKKIDAYYAKHYPGKEGIRLPNGHIVDKTPEAQAEVTAFEKCFSGPALLDQKMIPAKIELFNLEGGPFSHLPKEESEKRFEKLVETVTALQKEIPIWEQTMRNLVQLKNNPDLQSFVAEKSKVVDQYKELVGNVLVQYAALEMQLGKTAKAEELLQKAAKEGNPTILHLEGKEFTDTQLAAFSRFKNLRELSLKDTGITDNGMATITSFAKLENLNLYNNDKVTDRVMDSIAVLKSLKELHLVSLPKITGQGLEKLKALNMLTTIDFNGIAANAQTMGVLRQLPNLERIAIESADIGDKGLANLAGLPQLTDLSLSYTNISNAALAQMKSFPRLQSLRITDPLSDEGLFNLQGSTALQSLEITSDKIDGTGFAAFKQLPLLNHFELWGQGNMHILDRSLDSLAELKNIRDLKIHNEHLFLPGFVDKLRARLRNCKVTIREF